MGCKASDLPSPYLGLPLCIGAILRSQWNHVVERTDKYPSIWKVKHLPLKGRINFIKAALSNHPIYFVCIQMSSGRNLTSQKVEKRISLVVYAEVKCSWSSHSIQTQGRMKYCISKENNVKRKSHKKGKTE